MALPYCQFLHNISGAVKIVFCCAVLFFSHVYTLFALNVHVQGLVLSVHKMDIHVHVCVL